MTADGSLDVTTPYRAGGPLMTPAAGHPPTILVVDDEPAMLDLVAEMLADEGFMVHALADARQVLVRARAAPPDLILTDLMMPFLDGRAVRTELRAQPLTAH